MTEQPYPVAPEQPYPNATNEWERPWQFWSSLSSPQVQWVLSEGARRGYHYKVMNYVHPQGYWLIMEEN